MDLLRLFSAEMLQDYIDRIHDAAIAEQKAAVLEAFLLQQMATYHPEPDYIDEAVNLIVEKNGLLHINDLIEKSCMSRRTFERHFFKKVGLSPKYYLRIRRIGYIFNLIAGKQKVNWLQLLHQSEFYDQAHFIKDFEEFTGRTPQQYLQENVELARYVAKPVQRNILQ